MKNDPEFVAKARELRDRYLEQLNSGRLLTSGLGADSGKYDVVRALPAPVNASEGFGFENVKRLPAAA